MVEWLFVCARFLACFLGCSVGLDAASKKGGGDIDQCRQNAVMKVQRRVVVERLGEYTEMCDRMHAWHAKRGVFAKARVDLEAMVWRECRTVSERPRLLRAFAAPWSKLVLIGVMLDWAIAKAREEIEQFLPSLQKLLDQAEIHQDVKVPELKACVATENGEWMKIAGKPDEELPVQVRYWRDQVDLCDDELSCDVLRAGLRNARATALFYEKECLRVESQKSDALFSLRGRHQAPLYQAIHKLAEVYFKFLCSFFTEKN